MGKALLVLVAAVAAFALVSVAHAEIVSEDDLPSKARMTTTDGHVNFDLPPGKSFTVNRYTRALDSEAIQSEISMVLTGIDDTNDALSTLVDNIAPLATKGSVGTLEARVQTIEQAIANHARADEVQSLSSLVTVIDSTAEATASIGTALDDSYPSMESTIAETNSLATEVFTERLHQSRVLTRLGADLAGIIEPNIIQNDDRVTVFAEAVSSAYARLSMIEAQVSTAEAQVWSASTVNHFNNFFKDTHFGTNSFAVMRWAAWSTYAQCCNWYFGNSDLQFGGIAPSNWGNNNAVASSMSTDPAVIRNLFNKRIYCGASCNTISQEWYYYSSTNSRHAGVLIRVKNTSENAIDWDISFYYSSHGGYAESASISVNGQNTWTSGAGCSRCTRAQTLTIPPERTSTIIILSASGPPSGTRTLHQSFYDDCLILPDGLEYVDDLDLLTEF